MTLNQKELNNLINKIEYLEKVNDRLQKTVHILKEVIEILQLKDDDFIEQTAKEREEKRKYLNENPLIFLDSQIVTIHKGERFLNINKEEDFEIKSNLNIWRDEND